MFRRCATATAKSEAGTGVTHQSDAVTLGSGDNGWMLIGIHTVAMEEQQTKPV